MKDKMPNLRIKGAEPVDMVRAAKAKKKAATPQSVVGKILRK